MMNRNLIIKNASQLVTCSGFSAKCGKEMSDLHIIENGFVVIENGIISAVGDQNYPPPSDEFEIIDATGKAVLPGLVDSH
ncbi:MAG: imidazolonepropionase, partial [Deltaproteobacteria bacterium]